MADAFEMFTKFVQSPPGQFAVGGALGGIVWKFFERVEAVLKDDTKLEIAVWLLSRKKVSPTFQSWPDTFAKVFDRVFGKKHLSWGCFFKSSLATLVSCLICGLLFDPFSYRIGGTSQVAAIALITAGLLFVFDYISLLETRYLLFLMRRWSSSAMVVLFLLLDIVFTGFTGSIPYYWKTFGKTLHPVKTYADLLRQYDSRAGWSKEMLREARNQFSRDILEGKFDIPSDKLLTAAERNKKRRQLAEHMVESESEKLKELDQYNATLNKRFFEVTVIRPALTMWLPAFFTSIWLWLYASSGFLLKAARRFDVGFSWFILKADIEKKPLQCIGFVSGCIVATLYWTVALIHHFI
jgi:hypothetical protein